MPSRTDDETPPLPPEKPPFGARASVQQRGIQSIEVGGQVLRALVDHGRSMALKDLARTCGMAAAKVHPYLVSFGRIGLIEQDSATGIYRLGPLALQLGMISLQQATPVQVASPAIAELARRSGHTVALAVWGTHGATIVRLEESPAAVHVNMRHGTVFSLTGTASGRLFAAYLDPALVKRQLEQDRRRGRHRPGGAETAMPDRPPVPSWHEFQTQLAEVRERGLSRSVGEIVPGISAMAAPVLAGDGRIELAVVAIGPSAVFDTDWDGPVATALRACVERVSQRLGRL